MPASRIMTVMDILSASLGKPTVLPSSVPVAAEWEMRQELLRKSYTTLLISLES
ncbi:hypothetical protein D9M68_926920 [compost metagenome]